LLKTDNEDYFEEDDDRNTNSPRHKTTKKQEYIVNIISQLSNSVSKQTIGITLKQCKE
jgi:hypothetical protein